MKNAEKEKTPQVMPTAEQESTGAHQQQILFAENELASSQFDPQSKASPDGKQILFDNQDYLAIEENNELPIALEEASLPESESKKTNRKPRWLWRIALTLFAVVIGVETVEFFINGFTNSPILTSIYGIILSCLLLLASSALFSEWSTLRQFKRRQTLKQQAQQLLLQPAASEQQTINVEDFCQKITKNLPCDLVSEQEQAWQEALRSEHSSSELLQLYSRLVLTKVDEKAMREVAKFSTESVVLISLSPVALIDMLIMLWRNLRMINKVAGLYGLKLGYWSRIKLIRQVFVNMVYAGASELITDFGTDMIGADLLGKLSGRLAQGLGAGMLTARLGVKTMQLCRPIPFDEKPKLGHVRKEMLTTIKSLLSKKS
ncbi:MAG: YcjF family protein [Colwellia sp.]|nr:YcjF family protein [Colwellia sp.]MCW8863555.1 YcjF family protein [Colwellia sp.]MCW9082964.1 YcjF family protein [Colwellia sp.]